MVTRIFGAIKGAGVQVVERTPAQPVAQGPLGSSILAGIFRRGPVGLLVTLTDGLTQFRRVNGGLTQASEAPLSAEHFYVLGGGAGELHTLRITDGSEVAASIPVYNRDVARGQSLVLPSAKVAAQVATYSAHNGGRWGGRRSSTSVLVADMTIAIATDSTIDLGTAYLADQWEGAEITIPGVDASGVYTVTGNTAAGVATIEGTWSQSILDSVTTDEPVILELVNEHELTGDLEALSVEVADSGEKPASKFSLYAAVDGVTTKEWLNLELAQGSAGYWLDAIAGDLDNYELAAVDLFAGNPAEALARPANFAEIPAEGGVVANSVTFQIDRWTITPTAGGDYFLGSTAYTGTEIAAVIVVTFTAATTFTVAVTFDDGQVITNLPAGTLGTAYDSGTGLIPVFTLHAGATAAALSDTLTLYSRPLPSSLSTKGGLLYPAAAPSEGDVRVAYRIVNNDHDTVSVSPAIDLTAELTAPLAPVATSTTTGDYTLVGGETFIFDPDGEGDSTLTETLGAGTYTAQLIADELNTLEIARVAGAPVRVVFSATATNELVATLSGSTGAAASLLVRNGTLNAIVGYVDDTTVLGTDGKIARLQWRQELGGGYDGIAGIGDSDYEQALDPNTSPLNVLIPRNTGLLLLGVPGVSASAVQNAAAQWAFQHNGIAIREIPDTITTVSAAIAYHEGSLAIGAAQDYAPSYFPSYGSITNPYGLGLYTTSAMGAIMGLHARVAKDGNGYHLAVAGIDVNLSPLFKDLTTGDDVLNNESLNGYGLIEVRKVGASISLWGDRIPGSAGRPFLHKRKSLSHIGRVLLTNTLGLVWSPINEITFARVQRDLRELFRPWFLAGWFDDSQGVGFDDQVEIKVDKTNNPTVERQLGNLHADAGFEIVGTSERVIFGIGARGISESS